MLRKFSDREEGSLLPHIDRGHCELDSFQPQNHEESLAEWTVPHILTIMPSLEKTDTQIHR